MSHQSMVHRTATMARTYSASPARVFAAWADPEIRRLWGSPSDEVELRIDAADFRIGGEDQQTCVVQGEPVAFVTGRYHDIVPDRRIIYTEVISEADALLGMSLVSAEFIADGSGTRLELTLQTVAVDGSDLLDGVEEGWTSALDRLGAQLMAVV
ncbi:MAG: polyketide cyclase [Alphaproteobacteria bacterium HGW-Alphaproteobacteria-18]|nr:MAG: polyketide cyclase [Alphaproteobacteria bacterium HGW-Alphaproteobacteria-18]